jgi:2-oxoglutarate dehydrogenase E1 component
MYERVRKQVPVLQKYSRQLIEEGVITETEFKALYDQLRQEMDVAQTRSKDKPVDPIVDPFRQQWQGLTERYTSTPVDTPVPLDELNTVAQAIGTVPAGFNAHKNIAKLMLARAESLKQDAIDWGTAEMLA